MVTEIVEFFRTTRLGSRRWQRSGFSAAGTKPFKRRMIDALDPSKQGGMGYVEYLITCLGILFILFAPIPGGTGDSVVDLVLQAIREFGQNSSLLFSLP